jgi:hypothetical protein
MRKRKPVFVVDGLHFISLVLSCASGKACQKFLQSVLFSILDCSLSLAPVMLENDRD